MSPNPKRGISGSREGPPHSRLGVKTAAPKVKNIKGTILRIWSYMAGQKLLFTLVLIMIVVSAGLSLLGPYLLGVTVDILIADYNSGRLIRMLGLLALLFLIESAAVFLQNYWMITIAQYTVLTMRSRLFSHLQQLPLAFFQKRQSGELMSRLTNDMENVSRTLNSSFIQLTTSALTLTGTIIMMVWLSPLLTLLTLMIVPLMFLGMKWITKRTGRYFKEQQKYLGEMNGFIEETLAGHKSIKIYSQEQRVIDAFDGMNKQLKTASYWAQVYSGFIPKLMNSLNNISFTVIVGVGGLLAVKGFISIGIIVTFTTYARQFTRPLNDLANQYNVILSAVAGAERVFAILDEEPEHIKDKTAKPLRSLKGEIIFDNVSFSYQSDQATLEDVSFHVSPGQTVALVGPTGAGKTTIVSLLSRFYDTDSGNILLDGKDIKSLTAASIRDRMGVVLQDAHLFKTTVMENIRYGRLNASDEEVVKAAQSANAHAFIMKLPEGYQTILQPDGEGISHGQRQLLSIARAMLSNPSLLILDEATSSIDTVTEMKINDGLQKLMKGRTSFVIAHRLNTIKHADLILVLDGGRVVEQGNHRELIARQGYYAELSNMQHTGNNAL